MIKLKSLLQELSAEESVSIGDGYILRNVGHGIFKVYFGEELALSVHVVIRNNFTGQRNEIPWVSDAEVFPGHKGKGLYRRVLPILKDTFGFIRSDNRGNISDDAEKAWVSVGARKTTFNDKENTYGNSWYVL